MESVYKCSFCEATDRNKDNMKEHEQECLQRPGRCGSCGYFWCVAGGRGQECRHKDTTYEFYRVMKENHVDCPVWVPKDQIINFPKNAIVVPLKNRKKS